MKCRSVVARAACVTPDRPSCRIDRSSSSLACEPVTYPVCRGDAATPVASRAMNVGAAPAGGEAGRTSRDCVSARKRAVIAFSCCGSSDARCECGDPACESSDPRCTSSDARCESSESRCETEELACRVRSRRGAGAWTAPPHALPALHDPLAAAHDALSGPQAPLRRPNGGSTAQPFRFAHRPSARPAS